MERYLGSKAIRIYLSVRTLSVLVKCGHYNAEYRYPDPFLSIGANLHQHYCEIVNSRVVATHAGQPTAPLDLTTPFYNYPYNPPIILIAFYNSSSTASLTHLLLSNKLKRRIERRKK